MLPCLNQLGCFGKSREAASNMLLVNWIVTVKWCVQNVAVSILLGIDIFQTLA